jgi:hypothetical protein
LGTANTFDPDGGELGFISDFAQTSDLEPEAL